jgi:RNA polymerase sigma-70 factor (ECF subfamily)
LRLSRDGYFPTTQWTLVQIVQAGDPQSASRAMEELCCGYWYPIYAYLRRSGYREHDAEDMTQSFFAHIISEEAIQSARQEAGKLRSYLLGALTHLISDHQRHHRAQKRGGGIIHESLEQMDAEERYSREPVDARDPETIFMRAWAHDVVSRVRHRVRDAYMSTGRSGPFELLAPFLEWDREPPSHREVARQMGMSETASRLLIFRLREKFRALLREEIALTVLKPDDVEPEIAWLQSVLASC